jgi:hypothetical protein
MSRSLIVAVVMSLFLAAGNQVFGEKPDDVRGSMQFVAPEDMDEGAVMARTTRGVVQAIDLAKRMAQIDGYIYEFGSPDDPGSVEVKMYDSDFGALEMLQPGMKVEVVYGDIGDIRITVRLQQLADDADIEEH